MQNTNAKSRLYQEYLQNPIDLIEPSKTVDVVKMFPTLIPFLDTHIDRFINVWRGKEYIGTGIWIINSTEFFKVYNELPENVRRKAWISFERSSEHIEPFLQIKGIV